MDKFDQMIGRAMNDEDRALLARYAEQGYVSQAMGLFRGRMGAIMGIVYATVLATFCGAAYSFWRMTQATEPVTAVQWGVGALLLFQMTTMAKSYMGQHLEANRMLREIKRLELQVALLRADGGND